MQLQSMAILAFPRIDGGNIAANAASLLVPCKLILDKIVMASSLTDLTSNCSVRVDVIEANSRSNNACGTIVAAAAAGAGVGYYNIGKRGLVINAGSILSVEVIDAGDSGENVNVSLLCEMAPETEANSSDLIAG